MTLRHSLQLGALSVIAAAGCAGAGAETPRRSAAGMLMAYAGRSSDVTSTATAGGRGAIEIERIPQAILRDPTRTMAAKVAIERQIGFQVKDIPETRYRRLVRPGLAHALLAAGLSGVDVDYILHGVDYHRSL
jgi:hypothetical protein